MSVFYEAFYKTTAGQEALAQMRHDAYEEDNDPLVKLTLIMNYENIRRAAGITPEAEIDVIAAEAIVAAASLLASETEDDKEIMEKI